MVAMFAGSFVQPVPGVGLLVAVAEAVALAVGLTVAVGEAVAVAVGVFVGEAVRVGAGAVALDEGVTVGDGPGPVTTTVPAQLGTLSTV